MSKHDESIVFFNDINFSEHILLCGHCKTTKDKNPKCQTSMRIMHLWVMLVFVRILMCDYCKTTKDYIPECQSAMKVLFFI
jgi:primosomal protein N'